MHRSAGFVRFQQALARESLSRGSLGAARAALRILQTTDFTGDPVISKQLLAVLRNVRSTDDELLTAMRLLIELDPADL